MKKLFDWIKGNKLTFGLILVVLYFLFKNTPITYLGTRGMNSLALDYAYPEEYTTSKAIGSIAPGLGLREPTPQLDVTDRKVVTNTSLSIVVKDVVQTITQINQKTTELGGYMVNSNVTSPEEGGTGYISIRVPSEKLDEAMEAFKDYAVKVVEENVYGTDITDQYTDYEEQLRILESTKETFQNILSSATEVEDILNVQDRILNIQRQIDSIKGQLKYMDATSESSLISVNLSTDELSLPYSPSTWRPSVVYRLAIRALVQDLRRIGNGAIWVGVYAAIWLPVLVIILLVRKIIRRKKVSQIN